jgi:hypothetical protein
VLSDRETFEGWLGAYGRAWEIVDPQAAAEPFAGDAAHYEAPFGEPMRDWAEIADHRSDVPRYQDDVLFSCEVLATSEGEGVAHRSAALVRLPAEVSVRLDGILLTRLGADDRCAEFREWWHRPEE